MTSGFATKRDSFYSLSKLYFHREEQWCIKTRAYRGHNTGPALPATSQVAKTVMEFDFKHT